MRPLPTSTGRTPSLAPHATRVEFSGSARSAGTSLWLVVLLLALSALVLALLFRMGSERGADPSAPTGAAAPGSPDSPSTDPQRPIEPSPSSNPAQAASSAPASGADPPPAGERGSIRGTVSIARGGVAPAAWTLEIRPSRSLLGRERAVSRTLEFDGTVRDFRVDDLPFAGYDVRAVAPGMNAPSVPVLLRRESASPYVMLAMSPAGFIEGAVIDSEGLGVEGLGVSLEPLPEGTAQRVLTDVRGVYQFDAVLDGEYRIVFGHPLSAVNAPRLIDFRAPSLHVPDTVLDVMGRVRVQVLDSAGLGVPGARVRGQGSKGGYVDFVTDSRGVGWGHFLPAGRYRIHATHDDLGTGTVATDLSEREEAHLEIELRPE